MPAAPLPLGDVACSCRLTKRPRAFSLTVCGKPSKRRASNGKSPPKTSPSGRRKASDTGEESKLKKGCILVAENPDGSILFDFQPDLSSKQASSELTVLSPGQQALTRVKLKQVTTGSPETQLTFQLWDTASAHFTSNQDIASSRHSLHDQQSAAKQLQQESTTRLADASRLPAAAQQQTSQRRNSSTSDTLSLLLGLTHSPGAQQQPDAAPQYAFAASRDQSQDSANGVQQPALLQKPVLQAAPLQKPAQQPAQLQKAQPSLMQKPVRPPVEAIPQQDVASSRFHLDRDKWVPCYLWHESGLPVKADLRDYPYEANGDPEDSMSTSDSPASAAEPSGQQQLHQGSEAAARNVVLQAWRPIRQLFLRIWRLLPYWFRSRFRDSQQQEPPAVHASNIVAQHTMAASRDQVIEGSSYDLATGRSPTPLADVERHQIEDLIKMGVKDVGLFRTALTAPSAVLHDKIIAASFDRLEYLGDAVVSLAFRSWVYARFPEDDEGSMTNTANTLVSNRAHVQYANHIHLTSYIAQNLKYQRNNRVDEEVLADAFEALVGAIYLDSGLAAATKFIIGLAEEVMGLEKDLSSYRNYKLYLVNSVNQNELGRVSYNSRKRSSQMWQSKCRLQGRLMGIGLDRQRKQAESAAAYAAMEKLGFSDIVKEAVGQRPPRYIDRKAAFQTAAEQQANQMQGKDQAAQDQPSDKQTLEQSGLEPVTKDVLPKDHPFNGKLVKDKVATDKLISAQANKEQSSRGPQVKDKIVRDQLSRNKMVKDQLAKDQVADTTGS